MKKFIGVCFLSLVGFSAAAAENRDFVFNIGADAQWRSAPLQKNFGDNLIKKSYPQGSVYGGVKLDDTFGLEIGYQHSASAKRQISTSAPTSYFSQTLTPLPTNSFIFRSKVSMQGVYAGVLGLLPVSEEYRLKLIGSVGLVRMKTKIVSALDVVTPTATGLDTLKYTFAQSKWVPKLSAGVQHMLDDNFGVRATAGWEQTAKFKRIRGIEADGSASSVYFASLKNSTTLGLGMFYNF